MVGNLILDARLVGGEQNLSITSELADQRARKCLAYTTRGVRWTTAKKLHSKNPFPFFLQVRSRNSYFIENCESFSHLFYFRETQKSRVSAKLDCFFWAGSRQRVRPDTRQLSPWFSKTLRTRCLCKLFQN